MPVILGMIFSVLFFVPKVDADWGPVWCDIVDDDPAAAADKLKLAVKIYNDQSETLTEGCRVIRFNKKVRIPLPGGLVIRRKYPSDSPSGLVLRKCVNTTIEGKPYSESDDCPKLEDTDAVLDFSDYKNETGKGDCPIRVEYGAEALIKNLKLIARDKFKAVCRLDSLKPLLGGPAEDKFYVTYENVSIDQTPPGTKPDEGGKFEVTPITDIRMDDPGLPAPTCEFEKKILFDDGSARLSWPKTYYYSSLQVTGDGKILYSEPLKPGETKKDSIDVKPGETIYTLVVKGSKDPVCVKSLVVPPPKPAVSPGLKDSDGDGVIDSRDKCPDTKTGTKVDGDGCPVTPALTDSDGDGVVDSKDTCPGTKAGATVNGKGCEAAEIKSPTCPMEARAEGGGKKFTLTWKTTDATKVTLSYVTTTETVAAEGSKTVELAAPTVYTLRAIGTGGECTTKIPLGTSGTTDIVLPKPPACDFKETFKKEAGSYDLVWKCTNATSVDLDDGRGPQPVTPTGERKGIKLSKTTVYTLTGTGAGGVFSKSIPLFTPDRAVSDDLAEGGGGCSLTAP